MVHRRLRRRADGGIPNQVGPTHWHRRLCEGFRYGRTRSRLSGVDLIAWSTRIGEGTRPPLAGLGGTKASTTESEQEGPSSVTKSTTSFKPRPVPNRTEWNNPSR